MTYTYECEDCGEEMVVDQRIVDEPFRTHTEVIQAGGYALIQYGGILCIGRVSRLITGGCGTHFKGDGWTKKGQV